MALPLLAQRKASAQLESSIQTGRSSHAIAQLGWSRSGSLKIVPAHPVHVDINIISIKPKIAHIARVPILASVIALRDASRTPGSLSSACVILNRRLNRSSGLYPIQRFGFSWISLAC